MLRRLSPLLFALTVASLVHAQDEGTATIAKDRLKSTDLGGPSGDDDDNNSGSDSSSSSSSDDQFGGKGGLKVEGDETPSSAPEQYTVQPGDTLWGLSQRFLNNPWYWPKIWSYNQQLDNPNWIRPGTVLRFYPGEAPVEVSRPEEDEPNFENLDEGGGFEVAGAINNRMNEGNASMRREFFIPSDQLNDSGQILNSPEEKQMLVYNDRTYLKLKKGSVGDVLQILRKERELRHPVTGASVGTIVTEVGEVRVDQTGKEQNLGTIVNSWDPIERGYFVASIPVRTEPVKAVGNTKNIKGYVVDAAPAPLSFMGESYLAVIDKGSQDGVQIGNTFTIVRAGDPYTKEYSGMADEDIGEIVVVEVFKGSSSGLLTAASRVIVPGDRVEMRVK
jgi:LysM repeat protein